MVCDNVANVQNRKISVSSVKRLGSGLKWAQCYTMAVTAIAADLVPWTSTGSQLHSGSVSSVTVPAAQRHFH